MANEYLTLSRPTDAQLAELSLQGWMLEMVLLRRKLPAAPIIPSEHVADSADVMAVSLLP